MAANFSQSLREFLEGQAEQERRRQEIGEQIRQTRLQVGETQTAMASALRISNAYLSQIESGARTPSVETMTSIVHYLTERSSDAQDQD
jgi:DNA-binding XRE family transcriptional regulator